MSIKMKWEKKPLTRQISFQTQFKVKNCPSSVHPFYNRNTDIDISRYVDATIIHQTQFLGEILDFLGIGSFFNAEIGETEKCSEPVVPGL